MTGDVRVLTAGAPVADAKAAVVLLHGRGGTAEDILSLAGVLGVRDIAYMAPQAPGNAWYPVSFLAPIEQNEPSLSSSLAAVGAVLDAAAKAGLATERVALMGFSQGGCLALEYGARNARRYGALVGLSAGLIGPPGAPRDYRGSLAGTPVFLGCSDVDGHVPLWRVHDSARALRDLGAEVTERIYPGMGHTIDDDEIKQVRQLLMGL